VKPARRVVRGAALLLALPLAALFGFLVLWLDREEDR
jgi:hypothetical protein